MNDVTHKRISLYKNFLVMLFLEKIQCEIWYDIDKKINAMIQNLHHTLST